MASVPSDSRQEIIDREHLNLLAIFYYIMGGLIVAFSCFALIYVGLGLAIALNPEGFAPPKDAEQDKEMPAALGYMFAAMGGCGLVGGWTMGGVAIYTGRCLKQRKRRLFTMIVAGIICMSVPLGTILGVFTFVVLLRDSVREMYERAERPEPQI